MKKGLIIIAIFVASLTLLISLSVNGQTAPVQRQSYFSLYVTDTKLQQVIESEYSKFIADINIGKYTKTGVIIMQYKFPKDMKMTIYKVLFSRGYRNQVIESNEIETTLKNDKKTK